MKSFLEKFCTNTAIHGFLHFHQQKHVHSKAIWFVVLVLVFLALTAHLTLLVREYLQYGYIEKMEFSQNHVFPDVPTSAVI